MNEVLITSLLTMHVMQQIVSHVDVCVMLPNRDRVHGLSLLYAHLGNPLGSRRQCHLRVSEC